MTKIELPIVAPDRTHYDNWRVSLLGQQECFECVCLYSLGHSNKFIRQVTGLTDNEITYRIKLCQEELRRLKLTRQDYRDGTSPLAAYNLRKVAQHAARTLTPALAPR